MAYFAQAGGSRPISDSGARSPDTAYNLYEQQPPRAQQPLHAVRPGHAPAHAHPAPAAGHGAPQEPSAWHPQDAAGAYDPGYGATPQDQAGFDPAGYDPVGYEQGGYHDGGYEDDGYVPVTEQIRSGLARMASTVGAAASLALVVGIGFWGYKLVVRDVSGVPVVRAVEGPMRVQPDTPGGTPADHQGLAVNAVAANGTAERPADQLTLAPEAIALAEDDLPMAELIAPEAPEAGMELADIAPAEEAAEPEAAAAETGQSEIDALVAQLALEAGLEPAEAQVEPASADAAFSPAVQDPVARQPGKPGVRVSLRPAARPSGGPSAARSTPAASAAPASLDADPASLEPGTRMAQLGAFDSPDVARAEWDRLALRFGDYLEGKQRVVQKAESGGKTFYRLRVLGFDELSEARRFCSALIAGRADCIPVRSR